MVLGFFESLFSKLNFFSPAVRSSVSVLALIYKFEHTESLTYFSELNLVM